MVGCPRKLFKSWWNTGASRGYKYRIKTLEYLKFVKKTYPERQNFHNSAIEVFEISESSHHTNEMLKRRLSERWSHFILLTLKKGEGGDYNGK